jgi:hypothetical protein
MLVEKKSYTQHTAQRSASEPSEQASEQVSEREEKSLLKRNKNVWQIFNKSVVFFILFNAPSTIHMLLACRCIRTCVSQYNERERILEL